MILTYLSRHAKCNSLVLAVSQGIIKCSELWNIRESNCFTKEAMHEHEELTVQSVLFPLDSPGLVHCSTLPNRSPAYDVKMCHLRKYCRLNYTASTQAENDSITVEIVLQAPLQIYVFYPLSPTESLLAYSYPFYISSICYVFVTSRSFFNMMYGY